jgi:GNAT superfamily N-acetyltransferase
MQTTTATLETPNGPVTLHVCKDGTPENNEWVGIYNASFPPDQRQPLEELDAQLKTGAMELDETRDETGRILCMTLSEIFPPKEKHVSFVLACYTAVMPDWRGMGIGTVHRKKLEQLLQNEYGSYLGMFTEIESTLQHTDDVELKTTRVRRKNFFLKLGLKPLNVPYRFPSYDGSEPLEGELLWFPFAGDSLNAEVLERVVFRIYTEGYGLHEGSDFVQTQMKAIRESLTRSGDHPGGR